MDIHDLEARVRILEDIAEIQRLKSNYATFLDEMRIDELVELFAEDAIVEFGKNGRAVGKKAIGEFYRGRHVENYSMAVHILGNPNIVVDGDEATGSWALQASLTSGKAKEASWTAGRYQDEFIKEGGTWKIKMISIDPIYYEAPYEKGWAPKDP